MTYYFNKKTWAITTTKSTDSVSIPLVAVFLLTPLLGAIFVMVMPTLGFALLFHKTVWKPLREWLSAKRKTGIEPA